MGFELKIHDLYWIDDSDDNPDDLCLHGKVLVKIGDELVDDGTKDSWTVSAGAYHMLKSVYEAHIPSRNSAHMFPCCGHFMCIDETSGKLGIIGCPSGLDWTVTHEDDTVKLTTGAGIQATIPLAQYRNIVFVFADEIKAFYETCAPKISPTEAFEHDAWKRFWRDWEQWRHPQKQSTPCKKGKHAQNGNLIS